VLDCESVCHAAQRHSAWKLGVDDAACGPLGARRMGLTGLRDHGRCHAVPAAVAPGPDAGPYERFEEL
jgi:hypothetical protein